MWQPFALQTTAKGYFWKPGSWTDFAKGIAALSYYVKVVCSGWCIPSTVISFWKRHLMNVIAHDSPIIGVCSPMRSGKTCVTCEISQHCQLKPTQSDIGFHYNFAVCGHQDLGDVSPGNLQAIIMAPLLLAFGCCSIRI